MTECSDYIDSFAGDKGAELSFALRCYQWLQPFLYSCLSCCPASCSAQVQGDNLQLLELKCNPAYPALRTSIRGTGR